MDPTPLLAHSNTGGLHRFYELASSLRSWIWTCSLLIHSSFVHWWAITANPDYLGSWASRRTLRSWLFPLYLSARVLSSVWLRGWKIDDFLAICFAMLMWWLPVRNVWYDLLPVSWVFSDLNFVLFTPVAWTWSLLLLFFLGLHSYAISLFTGGCLTLISFHSPDQMLANSIACFLVLPLLFVVEFRMSSVYFDLQQKNQSLEMLLDKATDGSCSLEAPKGIIRSASPKLEKTLGTSGNLVGRRLYDFVQSSDHSAVHKILGSPSGVQQMNSTLVTCIQGSYGCGASEQVTFDARVIPFTTSAGILQICLQVQGEMRNVHNQTDDSQSLESNSAGRPQRNWLDSGEKRSNESESWSPAKKKSVSEVSELESRSPEKKPVSESSFAFTVTESMCSWNQRITQFPVSSNLATSPGSRVSLRDAGVQTGQPDRMLHGRGYLETNSPSWTQQHMNQLAHPMDCLAVYTRDANRPPLLPTVSGQVVSRVSRGRSPGVKRLRSPPRAKAKDLQSRAQPLLTEENNESLPDAKSKTCPTKLIPAFQTAQLLQAEEVKNLLPDVKSMPGPTKGTPAFPSTGPRQAHRRRKRLGHDVSQGGMFALTPVT